jgi:hypothetical protein
MVGDVYALLLLGIIDLTEKQSRSISASCSIYRSGMLEVGAYRHGASYKANQILGIIHAHP